MSKTPRAFAKTLWVIDGREDAGRFLSVDAYHAANLAWLKGVRPAPQEHEMREWQGFDPPFQVYELEPEGGLALGATDRKVYIPRPKGPVQLALPLDRTTPLD
jgi:hypothetical protein